MVGKNEAIEKLSHLSCGPPIGFPPGDDCPEFTKWHCDVEAAIQHIFANSGARLTRFTSIAFRPADDAVHRSDPETWAQAFRNGVAKVCAMLESMSEEIRTFWNDDVAALNARAEPSTVHVGDPRTVFVVHGRNETARKSMFEFLRAIGLKPLEWSQALSATGEATPYIGSVLDKAFSVAQAVVVLMTPDDEACLRKEFQTAHDEQYEKQLTSQARPNVLFEAGMAMGRYPKRTVLVQIGTLRPFSDIGGRYVLRLNNSSQRRQDLADRLRTAGCTVELTGSDWHTVGSFDLPEVERLPLEMLVTPRNLVR
jgi:predicted nucleotide-binding protein